MYRKLGKFFRLPFRKKRFLAEAFIKLGIGRLLVLLVPFRKIKQFVEKGPVDPIKQKQRNVSGTAELELVKWSVAVMSRYTPWKSKCLVQAITAHNMLLRRGIASTIYFGVARESESTLAAHAWLKCGEMVVTGDQSRERFSTVMQIGYPPGSN